MLYLVLHLRRALVALVLAGCAPAYVLDVAGRPVREPVVVASGDGMRLVADSGVSGWRVVAELLVMTAGNAGNGHDDAELALREPGETGGPGAPGYDWVRARAIVRENVACGARFDGRRGGGSDDPVQRQREVNEEATVDCPDLIRAEFRVSAKPRVGDSTYLSDGATLRGVRWTRPEAKP